MLPMNSLPLPHSDPTPLFDWVRGIHATELLVAAVAHFALFDRLDGRLLSTDELQKELGLETRPFIVLTTALRAMGLLARTQNDRWGATPMAQEHLAGDGNFSIAGYVALAAQNPSVLAMVERLRTNRPAGADTQENRPEAGTAFIYRKGQTSAMDDETTARALTQSLAGRARNVAPFLARQLPLPHARLLLDVGCGSGIYSFALLRQNPQLRAVLIDRPYVLAVAQELAQSYEVADRIEFFPGDMFQCDYPQQVDAVLLSNVLHDWDTPECRQLMQRSAAALRSDGRLLIHDVYLRDEMDGPLAIALYSAALFALTEGRAYSAAEYRAWMAEVGLRPDPSILPTLSHCGILGGSQ
jgi:SAM-dependent methyltransferase